MSIKKQLLFKDEAGRPIYMFRIPNNTGDYVDVSNFGARICGIYVHKPDLSVDSLINNISISPQFTSNPTPAGALISGFYPETFSKKVWDVAEEGENFVFFTTEATLDNDNKATNVKVGVRIMWVNLNRLIIDYFITPQEDFQINLESRLDLSSGDRFFDACTFCSTIQDNSGNNIKTSDTPYKEMSFVPLEKGTPVFLDLKEEIKPMLELSDKNSLLRLSVYSTLPAVLAKKSEKDDAVLIEIFSPNPEHLLAGQTLAHRVIYGIDYIEPPECDDGIEPNPFDCFTK